MRTIFLIMILLSSISQAEFTTKDGVVTDSKTKLEWQNYNDKNSITRATWSDAIDYCESLNLNGKGWRLPNINELKSFIYHADHADYSDDYSYNVNSDHMTYYWSSTTSEKYTEAAFSMDDTVLMITNSTPKNTSLSVRCVRFK